MGNNLQAKNQNMTSPVLLLTLKQARIKNAKQNIIYFLYIIWT